MTHLLRRAFNGVAAVSAVLCIATAGLWVRSYRVQDEPTFARRGRAFLQLTSIKGDIFLDVVRNWPDDGSRWYTGSPDDHFGPVYCASLGLSTRREWPGIVLTTGDYSVATARGHVLIERHDGEMPQLFFQADFWPTRPSFELEMPDGYYVAAFSVLPLAWAAPRLRRAMIARRRRRGGMCPACGYDLRATRDRCPECGAIPGNSGPVGWMS
jgi:hypothetical protein